MKIFPAIKRLDTFCVERVSEADGLTLPMAGRVLDGETEAGSHALTP